MIDRLKRTHDYVFLFEQPIQTPIVYIYIYIYRPKHKLSSASSQSLLVCSQNQAISDSLSPFCLELDTNFPHSSLVFFERTILFIAIQKRTKQTLRHPLSFLFSLFPKQLHQQAYRLHVAYRFLAVSHSHEPATDQKNCRHIQTQ